MGTLNEGGGRLNSHVGWVGGQKETRLCIGVCALVLSIVELSPKKRCRRSNSGSQEHQAASPAPVCADDPGFNYV